MLGHQRKFGGEVIKAAIKNGKQITDGILFSILFNFKQYEKLINKIKAYQSKYQLQNEKGPERYIDKILTEKAEKK